MKPALLPLTDNALFLQNFRERNRSAYVWSAVILSVIIISLITLSAIITPSHRYDASGQMKDSIPWAEKTFLVLSWLQGFLILFLGSLAAYRMAVRERVSGTLDFHRSSPTTRFNQIIGLLLGAPSLEWFVFLGSMLYSFILVLISGIPILLALKFYTSLSVCAVFYHSIAILIGVWNTKSLSLAPREGIIKLSFLFFGLVLVTNLFYDLPLSGLYYLGWFPFYNDLSILIMHPPRTNYIFRNYAALHSLFTVPMETLTLQLFVQLPFLGLAWTGISRKISQPERPTFSKAQTALLTLFFLFLFTGSSISALFYYDTKFEYSWNNPANRIIQYFLFLSLLLGLGGALSSTPTRELFLKGLRRAKNNKQLRVDLNDDHATNVSWLLTTCFIIAAIFSIIGQTFYGETGYKVISLFVILSFLVFFASALEHFRLGVHHKKMSLFWTGLSILWIFLPIFGLITNGVVKSPYYLHFFLAASPIFGIEPIFDALKGASGQLVYGIEGDSVNLTDFKLFVSLFVNGALAILMSLLATRKRHELFHQIYKKT